MTDEELCKALRKPWFTNGCERYQLDAADRIEALTEQLAAARDDAKEAEAYAEELERDLNICRMAQVVMDNGIAEVEKERDDYAFKLADANNTYSEMHVALSEANDKLAKSVEALKAAVKWADSYRWAAPWVDDATTTLAEIEGEKT